MLCSSGSQTLLHETARAALLFTRRRPVSWKLVTRYNRGEMDQPAVSCPRCARSCSPSEDAAKSTSLTCGVVTPANADSHAAAYFAAARSTLSSRLALDTPDSLCAEDLHCSRSTRGTFQTYGGSPYVCESAAVASSCCCRGTHWSIGGWLVRLTYSNSAVAKLAL